MYRLFVPLSHFLSANDWPFDLLPPLVPDFLDRVHVVEHTELATPASTQLQMRIVFQKGDLTFKMPDVFGFSVAFTGSKNESADDTATQRQENFEDQAQDLDFSYDDDELGDEWLELAFTLSVDAQGWELVLHDAELELEIPPEVLRKVKETEDEEPDPLADQNQPATLTMKGDLIVDDALSVRVEGFDSVDLAESEIAETGFTIQAKALTVDIPSPTQVNVSFAEAEVEVPPWLALSGVKARDCIIDSRGLTGRIEADFSNPVLLSNLPFELKVFEIELKQSAFVSSLISGTLSIPGWTPSIEVDVTFDRKGNFAVRLAGGSTFRASAGGPPLQTIETPVLSLALESLALAVDSGTATLSVSGQLTPRFLGLDWPTFDVQELSIDSKGYVHIDGGWLEVKEQRTLDLYGFKIEISAIGFGATDDGGKWIGFSGGLKLVEGLQAGASVEGLRITWYDDERKPKITLNGASVELTIPDVLHLKGAVSFRELDGANPGEKIRRFDGDVHLSLETPQLEIDGTLVIGSVRGPQGRYNFFAIYVEAELPAGIPLAATGLGIYGLAGLFALQMEPNKRPTETWFSIDHSKSFYHRDTPGITDLAKKWEPRRGSFAIGAGITLGTLADNGHTFNGKFLLAIVIPGPIILLQGAAAFLKKRAEGQDEGQFRALAVLDGRAASLLIGLDAEYRTGKSGELIEIAGSMEAFYAFHDPTVWHLYLGRDEPRALRIRALLGRFVEANAYFMLDAHSLALGAWFGYDNRWSFGPLAITLEAWVEGNARLGFKPSHFHGDLWLHCLLGLKVFGFGLGLSLDARIAADLFTPYHLRGDFSVGIKLPWPFKKKLGATVVLEWGPRPQAPPLPLPVKQVAVEHLKSTVVWPLPRGRYLEPNWDDGAGFLASHSPETTPDLLTVPRVPLDGRLSVTFDRSVHDLANVGINLQQIIPSEPIGSPGAPEVRVRYVLECLALRRWDDQAAGWQLVAQSPKTAGLPALFGSWAVVPRLPAVDAPLVGQTKLLFGVLTPFEFTRSTGSSMEEWASDALPDYPCIPQLPAQEICFGFADLKPGTRIESPWTFPGPPVLTLSWSFGPATVETRLALAAGGGTRQPSSSGETQPVPVETQTVTTLCFPAAAVRRGLLIRSSTPGRSFRIVLARSNVLTTTPVLAQQPAPDIQPVPETLVGHLVPSPIDTGAIAATPATCIDFRLRTAGTVANPWSGNGVRFTVRGADGAPLPIGWIERWGAGPLGLNAGFQLDVDLPCVSPWAELIVTHRPPFRIVAFNAAGIAVATQAPQGAGGEVTETIHLDGAGMTRLTVYAAGNERLVHSVCFACTLSHGPSATGHGVDGQTYGPFFFPSEGMVVVDGAEMPEVAITGDGPLCLRQICVTPDPEAGQVVRREEVIQHIREELARWQAEGEVLAPHTAYQLTIQTRVTPSPLISGMPMDLVPVEHAYFRTGGPPGLTSLDVPVGTDTSNPFVTGLEDLTRYVRETDPPTVAPPGEKPALFRPFYRAYDIGVEFNENYVEQMYRMDRRDLGLYLYDSNNQPARDAQGRLVALANRWGQAETLTLSNQETRWLTLIDAATCLPSKPDPQTFPHDDALASAEPGRVLAPDTLHEVRLVPLLFHDAFTEGAPGVAPPGWYAEDAGSGGPSQWRVMEEGEPPARHLEQAAGIGGAGEPERPGTALLLADSQSLPAADRPGNWTDYRLSVHVRSAAGGAVGVIFRYVGPGSWYRFALHERVRQLVKAGAGGVTVLAVDDVSYRRNQDYLLTVEAIGKSLRAYVDGEPVFAVDDGDLAAGRIGLYACQSPGARFADVRVDDFRAAAPVVYRFQLTTSLYANFFHHLHSFQDETWPGPSLGAAAAGPLAAAVAASFTPPSEPEARAYEELATLALGSVALQRSARVEITRLTRAVGGPVLLLRSPEPVPPERVEIELSNPPFQLEAPATPFDLKLTELTFGAQRAEEESVTVLVREETAPTRHRIEVRELPGPLTQPAGDPFLLLESFGDAGALARLTIVDSGTSGGPSHWQIEGGALLQLSAIRGGSEPEQPGTQALTGDPAWTDYRLTVDLRSDAGSSVGVVFRWIDAANHYRLSTDATLGFRRLVKVQGGAVTILWEGAGRYSPGEPFRLEVEAVGSRLTGYLNGGRLFVVADAAHAAGQVGLYAWNDPTLRGERIEVRLPSLEGRALLGEAFAGGDLSGWSLLSETPGVPLAQAAAWETAAGALRLRSLLAQGGDPDFPGALAVAGNAAWTDLILSVRLRSKGGAIGVVFRGQNLANYYRFSMSRERGLRQLVKKVNGQAQVLWSDAIAYEVERSYELTIAAVGTSLRGWLDGVPLFAVQDSSVTGGRIALYAWSNPEAWFSVVRVWPADRAFAAWTLDEPFAAPVPGRWSFLDESGQPDPVAWTAGGGELRGEPGLVAWEGPGGGMDGAVSALAVGAAGGGEVYAGGNLTRTGGIAASRIGVWSAGAWRALGAGVDGTVHAIAVDGDRVYVGGLFANAGGRPAQNVALWNRTAGTWSALGSGAGGVVLALAVDGDHVYAGGQFAAAGGVAAANLAAWDRQAASWSAVGGGVDGQVQALAARGGRLYVGGQFDHAGGKPASRVALWDGTGWAAASGVLDGAVSAIAVADGPGALFYVGGTFTQAGTVAANRIARWTGTAWALLGGGVNGPVGALALDGNQLWVAGQFTAAGGAPASRIARWNLAAQTWSPLGEGLADAGLALAVASDRLWVGGTFTAAGSVPAQRIAALPLGGTRFAVTTAAAAGDFRLATRLVPAADGAAAVVLRFVDASHHLSLWLDAERGLRRLVRMAGAQSEVLWQDSAAPTAGREYAITIDAVGERVTGFVDGVELFDLAAAPVPGSVGFALRRSPAARFREVRLAATIWTCWYAFGEEDRLLAGTRIRVQAAAPAAPATPEPGMILRSVALPGESGRLRLRRQGAALRLVAPGGSPGHARIFLDPAAYAPVPVQALRKADGTGLFLLPDGSAGGGPLRLQLTYHRDRPEAGRAFSQAGDKQPERVTIDIP